MTISPFVDVKPAFGRPPAKPAVTRPVLLIDLDDLGTEQFETALATGGAPSLARLLQAGRRWKHFWAAPNCSLFRARVLSGADAYRPENHVGRLVQTFDQFTGPAGTWLPSGLSGQKVKLGKWHLSNGATFPGHIIPQGYDRFVGNHSNLFNGGTGYYDWKEYEVDASGTTIVQQTQHQTSRLSELILGELAAGTQLIHASYCAVHLPLELPPNNEPAGKVYSGTTDLEIRAAMLFHLDHWLGVVIAEAVQRGYVVIIACDNGTKDAGKNSYKEAGSNTPLLAWGAGVIPGVSSRLVAATDLWATVRRLRGDSSGLTAPDSIDFSDDLLGYLPSAPPRQFLTMDWYPGLGVPPNPGQWSRMIRGADAEGRWKYVDQVIPPAGTSGDDVNAFFDLLNDPLEQNNLLGTNLSVEARAALAELLAHLPQ